MREGIEVLEGEVAAVVDGVEGGEYGGPVSGAVEEEAEGVEIELVGFLAVFLEVDVLDPLAEERNPVLGEVVLHDIAGVEVDFDVLAGKAIDEGVHLLRAVQ